MTIQIDLSLYKIVPIIPTQEMRSAAGRRASEFNQQNKTFFAGDAWEPMVAAAPDVFARQNDESQNVAIHAWYEGDIPPVGLAFEFTSNGGHNWVVRTILYKDDSVILLDGHQLFKLADPDIGFRPARTPEQIAADEREHKIRNALTSIAKSLSDLHESEELTAAAIVEAMIDAGYIKEAT